MYNIIIIIAQFAKNGGALVLGCIEADLCEVNTSIHLQHVSSSTRYAQFYTTPPLQTQKVSTKYVKSVSYVKCQFLYIFAKY